MHLEGLKELPAGSECNSHYVRAEHCSSTSPDSYHDTAVKSRNFLGFCIWVNKDKYLSLECVDAFLAVDSGECGKYFLHLN